MDILCVNKFPGIYQDQKLDKRFVLPTLPTEVKQDALNINLDSSQPIDPNETPLVAVIGVGYVGTHLVETFSRKFATLGYDVSESRIEELRQSFDRNSNVTLTCKPSDLANATHFLISVPTLLLADKSIDSSYLRSALKTVASQARRGATVVIESSCAIGMTRELLGPLAKLRGYYAGMSPERVDPGRVDPPAFAIPKVVSGLDDVVPGSLDSIMRLYSLAFNRIVPVSKPEVAEMTKLYENCQRMMCIAYVNEMADACVPHDINPYEVCAAASTKPFGYMPYTPGVGLVPLLEEATMAMYRRPAIIASQTVEKLLKRWAESNKAVEYDKPRVLVVGVGFKAGQSTLSNSPSLELIKHLSLSGSVTVSFADPLVLQERVPEVPRLADEHWNRKTLETFDMILVTMRQVGLDFTQLEGIQGVEVKWWCA